MTAITELKKLAEATAPGPWEFKNDGYVYCQSTGEKVCSPHSTLHDSEKISAHIKDVKRKGKFIAAANPATILQMIALIEQMGDALECHADIGVVAEKALAAYKEMK